jgi:hypothetical protein
MTDQLAASVLPTPRIGPDLSKAFRLTADDIISGGVNQLTPVILPMLQDSEGRPGVVYVRPLTAGRVIQFISQPPDKQTRAMIGLVAYAVVSENGERLFANSDVEKLEQMRADVFMLLSNAVSQSFRTATASLTVDATGADATVDGSEGKD